MNQQLLPIRNLIKENASKYPVTYEKLVEFLAKVHGVSNVREIAQKNTDDHTALLQMLNDTHDLTTDRSLKSRINRIKKQMSNPGDPFASDSDLSQAETN